MGVRKSLPALSRVNPAVPATVALIGVGLAVGGYRWVGFGVAIGAALAFINALLLSQRVEMAADIGNIGVALLVMQLGLLLTATIVGLATIVLIHFSLAMAVASAAGFLVTQLAILATFFFTRARSTRMENAA
jgi:hypothetical protein